MCTAYVYLFSNFSILGYCPTLLMSDCDVQLLDYPHSRHFCKKEVELI